jgi:hypothetical protein
VSREVRFSLGRFSGTVDPTPAAVPKRLYSKDEADAILARALEIQGRGDGMSHDDLVAAGREVGVPREAIDRAAAEIQAKRLDAEALREVRGRTWRGFYAHLVPYVLVNLLLSFVNVMTGGPPWVLFVTLGWGIGLGSHLLAVANPDPRRLRRWVERERRRHELVEGGRVRVSGAARVDGGVEGEGEEKEDGEEFDDGYEAARRGG